MERGSIGKDSFKLTVSQMGALVIGMVSAMLLSRFRTLAEYGTYSQMYLLAGVLSPIIMMGIPQSLTYFLPRAADEHEKRKLLSQNLIATSALGILTGVIILLLKNFLVEYFTNPLLGSLIVIIALFPWTRTLNSTVQHFLVIYNRTSLFLVFKVAHSTVILLAVVATVTLGLDFRIYMVMFIVVEAFFALIVFLIAAKVAGGLVFYFNIGVMKKILAYSLPIGLAGTIGSMNRHIDELVIGRFFSTADLAVYTNAARELPLKLLGVSIATALLPRLVLMIKERNMGGAVGIWKESIKVSYVFMCYFSTVLIVYAPEIITILYSAKYLPGVTVFRIYSIIMMFNVTYFSMILSSLGKTKFILYSTLASLFFNIVLSVILYRIMGFSGPAVATLISTLIYRFSQLGISTRLAGVSFRGIFPWKSLGLITLANAAFGVLFVLLGSLINLDARIGQLAESILFGAIWMIVYMGVFFKYIKRKWDILNLGRVD